jgi:hypothetical protein
LFAAGMGRKGIVLPIRTIPETIMDLAAKELKNHTK